MSLDPTVYCTFTSLVTSVLQVESIQYSVESQQSAPYTYFICWDQIYLCTAWLVADGTFLVTF